MYPARPTAAIAKELGRSYSGVSQMASTLGLKKTAEYIKAHSFRKGSVVGRDCRFQKGHVPANKGLKRPGWYAGRMRETQFKKGARQGVAAKKWMPIGTIRVDREGYVRIKVREAKSGEHSGFGNSGAWPLLNRHVWEQNKGPIPPKHIVAFKDRDRSNCAIENLELMSMADNARRNSMWAMLPRELAEALQMNGALKRQLRRLGGKE